MNGQLDYDEPAAVCILAELKRLSPEQRIDTLAVVVKAFIHMTDAQPTDGTGDQR